jgi:hypothetical protein
VTLTTTYTTFIIGQSTFTLLESFYFVLDDVLAYSKPDNFDWKAAPWWVQKEELAKLKCQSSCTLNSRGVNTRVNLCDDQEVGHCLYYGR